MVVICFSVRIIKYVVKKLASYHCSTLWEVLREHHEIFTYSEDLDLNM